MSASAVQYVCFLVENADDDDDFEKKYFTKTRALLFYLNVGTENGRNKRKATQAERIAQVERRRRQRLATVAASDAALFIWK